MLARPLAFALVTSTLLALPAGGSVPAGCTDNTVEDAIPLAGYYMVGTAWEFWEESNGVPGLQRQNMSCPGPDIPRDTCIKHSENGALVGCALEFGGSLA